MFKCAAEKDPTTTFALLLGAMVLIISTLSIQSVMASFLAGHEFRLLQAGLAEIAMGLVILMCALFLFAPLGNRWNKKQLIFLAIAAFAIWRLTIIHHLLNLAMGITT
jgi:mannose/fructose/N-acetylgalactosamine-specific phosphotransferase system component IID